MLTLFISKVTWLHQQSAGRKLATLALASIGLLAISSLAASAALFATVLMLYLSLGRVGLGRLGQSLKTLGWLVALIAGAQLLIASLMGSLDAALLAQVAVAMTKLATLVLLAELVTITTPLQALLAAVEPLLRPLNSLGLSSERLALGVGLLIRVAGLQRCTWLQLQQAYQARGFARPGLRLIAPSLRAGLRQADVMAQALQARTPRADPAHAAPAHSRALPPQE
ncbi:MAG: hypothetical protein ACO38B_07825 [Burkholderiaceae bacterium]